MQSLLIRKARRSVKRLSSWKTVNLSPSDCYVQTPVTKSLHIIFIYLQIISKVLTMNLCLEIKTCECSLNSAECGCVQLSHEYESLVHTHRGKPCTLSTHRVVFGQSLSTHGRAVVGIKSGKVLPMLSSVTSDVFPSETIIIETIFSLSLFYSLISWNYCYNI